MRSKKVDKVKVRQAVQLLLEGLGVLLLGLDAVDGCLIKFYFLDV